MNDASQNATLSDKTLDQMAADIAAYQPPPVAAAPQMSAAPMNNSMSSVSAPMNAPAPLVSPASTSTQSYTAPAMPSAPAQAPVAPVTSAPEPMPTAPVPAAQMSSAPTATPDRTESLEAQNIFELLGVNNGSDSDKESFLDELQQVIWEDFLTSDIQLLLTRAELAEVQTIRTQNQDPAKQQEAVVTYLEKLIPDMENIMLEKALELKREMVRERITGMRSYLASKPEKLAELDKTKDLMRQEKWATITRMLNSLAAS